MATPSDDQLFDLIAEETQVDRAALNRNAGLADLGIASLDVMSILFEVEERFGIQVEDEDLAACTTLGELMDKLAGAGAAAAAS
jgi:acyl carrier protein